MNSLVRFLYVLALGTTLSVSAFAHPFPRGCEGSGFGFQRSFLTLNDTGSQRYFLIQNHSHAEVELKRITTEDAFVSPKLEATIGPSQWAAFASDVGNMHFKCLKRTGDEEVVRISCRSALDVCQYPRVRFAVSNKGTYWVSTNKSQQQVVKESAAKGIYLKW